MKVEKTDIIGTYIFTPDVHRDERGYFMESFSKEKFDKVIPNINFVQDNESSSTQGVLRGLHFQNEPYAQSKLVRCVQGEVYDVAVDLRKDSSSYMQWFGVKLSPENAKQFFIPKGCAHGFVVLSDKATFQYKVDEYWHPESEDGINAFDPKFEGIWPEGITSDNVIMSEKDRNRKLYE